MDSKVERLQKLLGDAFDSDQEGLKDELSPEQYAQRRFDFVFHMTDWLGDLRDYSKLVENPETTNAEDVSQFLIGFLYHVVPHINAAGRLLLDRIPDPFVEQHLATTAGETV